MGKHTPMPWKLGIYYTSEEFKKISEHVAIASEQSNALVAIVGPTLDADSMGDAQLMAAAPELLEACKAALPDLQYVDQQKYHVVSNALHLLRVAIAKAEGKKA